MSTRAVIRAGTVEAVYDDRWHALLTAIGAVHVERASEVEYDHDHGEWVAISRATGEEIARGTNRSEIIASEVRWLEERL